MHFHAKFGLSAEMVTVPNKWFERWDECIEVRRVLTSTE